MQSSYSSASPSQHLGTLFLLRSKDATDPSTSSKAFHVIFAHKACIT
jgi:hypothetical protein